MGTRGMAQHKDRRDGIAQGCQGWHSLGMGGRWGNRRGAVREAEMGISECQERHRTRWRPEAEGREDSVPGAAGQRTEMPGRQEQQVACGLGEAVR